MRKTLMLLVLVLALLFPGLRVVQAIGPMGATENSTQSELMGTLDSDLVSVSGTVFDSEGNPLADQQVWAVESGTLNGVGWTDTDSFGRYTFLLTPGSYKLQAVWETDAATTVLWYGDAVSQVQSTNVVVVSGEEQADMDFHFSALHTITGKVLGSDGVPLANQEVFCYPAGGGWKLSYTRTDDNGCYILRVPAGQHKIGARLVLGTESMEVYYGGGSSTDGATSVDIAADVNGMDITIPVLTPVSGTLFDSDGMPLSGQQIRACDSSTLSTVAWTETNTDGSYSIMLPQGEYKLTAQWYRDPTSSYFWYGNVAAYDQAVVLNVLGSEPYTNMDIHYPVMFQVSGRIRGGEGLELGDLEASCFPLVGRFTASVTRTDSDGGYVFYVPAGQYKVRATLRVNESRQHIYYDDDTSFSDGLTLDVSSSVEGIDIRIPALYSISGQVTGPDGEPMVGVTVRAVDAITGDANSTAPSETDSLGNYTLSVPPGSYRIMGQVWNEESLIEFYAPGTLDHSLATVVNVADEVLVPDIDISIPRLSSISGRVLDAAGIPCSSAIVLARDPEGQTIRAETDADGRYELSVLAGSYRVGADIRVGRTAFTVWHGKTYNELESPLLQVSGGGIAEVDIQIPPLHAVSGSVRGSDGSPVANIGVQASLVEANRGVAMTMTDATGLFSFLLPEGTYSFNSTIDSGTGWLLVWYGDDYGTLYGMAPEIAVESSVADVDIQFPELGYVTGCVCGYDEAQSGTIQVAARDYQGRPIGNAWIDSTGHYAMPLPAGEYHIGTHTPYSISDWKLYAPSVSVTAGATTNGIDIHLDQPLPEATMFIPSQEVFAERPFDVRVNISGCGNVLAGEFRLAYDPSLIRPIDVLTGSLGSGFVVESNLSEPGTIAIAMASDVPVSGPGELLRIRFEPIPGATGSCIVEFREAVLNDGAIHVSTIDGVVDVVPVFSIHGGAIYYAGGQPVEGVALQLTGNVPMQASNDASGQYAFSEVPAGEYVLTPRKSDEITGITSYDASLVLRSAVGKIALSPEQCTAADVDGNDRVGAMDASYILQHAVGLSVLPLHEQGQVWAFTPSSRNIVGSDADIADQDFAAILIGDVSGNWQSSEAMETLATGLCFELELGTKRVAPGGTATLPLMLDSLDQAIYSADLVIGYDPDLLQGILVAEDSQADGFQLDSNTQVPGELRIGLASCQPFSGQGKLLELTVQATNASAQSAALDLITADVDEIPALQVDGRLLIALPGDANLDNAVSIEDLAQVAFQYGAAVPEIDMNNDGIIDLFDLVAVARHLAA